MQRRDYMLVEVPVERRLWPDIDLIVRLMEYVRLNFRSLVPGLPAECEVDLLATGTAHNVGPRPALGLYAPAHVVEALPGGRLIDAAITAWCGQRSDDELRELGRATLAPTWSDLQSIGRHPPRDGA